jgi:hypothetical protein
VAAISECGILAAPAATICELEFVAATAAETGSVAPFVPTTVGADVEPPMSPAGGVIPPPPPPPAAQVQVLPERDWQTRYTLLVTFQYWNPCPAPEISASL